MITASFLIKDNNLDLFNDRLSTVLPHTEILLRSFEILNWDQFIISKYGSTRYSLPILIYNKTRRANLEVNTYLRLPNKESLDTLLGWS